MTNAFLEAFPDDICPSVFVFFLLYGDEWVPDALNLEPTAMSTCIPSKRMACTPCSKTKRKCSKQTHSCRRCIEKGIVCRYPAPRIPPPYDIVFSEDGACTAVPNSDEQTSLDDAHDASSSVAPPLSSGGSVQVLQLQDPWFLSPSSWKIDHKGILDARIYFGDGALSYFIDQLRSWLREWTSQGHSPFIHANLYKVGLPECIQDAFTALAAYQLKTLATERMVFRIVEHSADRLLEQQSLYAGDVGVIMLDTVAHLARTQALLVYCIICLFDGDIRARCHAEARIETLMVWAKQLWQSAGLNVASDGAKESSPNSDSQGLPVLGLKADGTVPSVWLAWSFSESIRRTYITATLTTAAYLTLKQGWAPCPGGITFTPGNGLWVVASPYSWWREMNKSPAGPLQCVEAHEIFTSNVPSDVDEFTHAVLIVTFGLEQFRQWQDRTIPEKTSTHF